MDVASSSTSIEGQPVLAEVQAFTRPSLTHARNQDRAVLGTRVLADTTRVERMRLEGPALVAVLDGLGGHPAGDVASDIAAHVLARAEVPRDEESAAALMEQADQALHDAMRDDPRNDRMGTTAVALSLSAECAVIANVGDSPVLRLTRDGLVELSLSDRGPGSGITQCLGDREVPLDPHAIRLELAPGDRLLLASDGLTDVIPRDDIERVLRDEVESTAEALSERVEAARLPDDLTIVIVDVLDA
jgi:PPM family protein phosphatase